MQEEERLIQSGESVERRSRTRMDSPSVDENQDLGFFKVWLVLSQLLGLVCLILVTAWCGQYLGGFAWQSDPQHQFNHHPFFMVLGLVFCYGNALLVYRAFRNKQKRTLKLLHFALHSLAFVFAVVALKAVFDSHNLATPPIPNLYSAHSWLGLSAVILFTLQYIFGFVAFLFPGLRKLWRSKYLPIHVFFGVAIFLMVIAAALMGITEKLMFSLKTEYKFLPAAAWVGNLLAYCLVLFAALVVYLVTTSQYRRRMLPEEVQLQLDSQNSAN